MSEVTTVLLHPRLLFREAIQRLLVGTRFELATHAPSFDELSLSASDDRVMFIVAPSDQPDGHRWIRQARSAFPNAWIVLLSSSGPAASYLDALAAGANAFLTKSLSSDAMIKSLDLITLGAITIPAELMRELLEQRAVAPVTSANPLSRHSDATSDPILFSLAGREIPLSTREMSILGCIQKGDSNKLIARQYHLAEATVKVHVKAILRKLGARNRTQAAIWAMNQANLNATAWSEPMDKE